MDFTLAQAWPALVGGVLIGAASTWLLFALGRIAGISGLFNGVLRPQPGETLWRVAFLAGLVLSGVLVGAGPLREGYPLVLVAASGLLVGVGTRIGSGCTSGHGVCGLARRSPRSAVAVFTFLATGFVTMYVLRHVLGVDA